jgi:cytochrome c
MARVPAEVNRLSNQVLVSSPAGRDSVNFVWRNPATNAVEAKHSLIQRVDNVLLGVGYYIN